MSHLLNLGRKQLLPTDQEAGWVPELVQMTWGTENSLNMEGTITIILNFKKSVLNDFIKQQSSIYAQLQGSEFVKFLVQCVPLATEPGIEDIATKFEHEYVRCVRNEEECVCGAPNCCDTEQRSASQW